MQFNITGRHLDISPALREHIEKMLNRLEQTYQNITSAQVTLRIVKHEKIAETTLSIAASNDIHAEGRHEDMYAAIDLLAEKLEKQLQRQKEKLEER
ncbi:ribosome hibernation-promoting factor, HPF/YfiA family [Dichelobacter nodosus]|uniref:Ribosome hibernation promoting factor n=1 Tax=Dichelobacter nodosus (strain VCS1703A) TaxID=246195 RepID=A5EVC1_DICNV|nr:ribosome-associated translation inhibitor RaiA [Dichelobacter nodosus]ABQ14035.1 sigma-54 modulation protein/S30EA ribosomal family protein [Dichelobacter nodosus VCS1703A]AXM45483.1 ribosome-associated translation inhibitor RaiA [Dichelobacter nodosus]KNZ39850.1 ribosome hibernation promoting factor HPF [Dichelobacter nodosus]TGA66677.1 ribosome-associated translation inhibitor RaiA [Dichelobacter nodosus]